MIIMKKRLRILSLAITFVFLFSSLAMAAVPSGIYIGGDVGKYYSLPDYVADADNVLNEMNSAGGLANIAYVTADGKIAKANEIIGAGSIDEAYRDIADGDLAESYTDKDGNTIETGQQPPQGDLEVISVSAINQNMLTVTFNKEVDRSTAITKNNYKFDGAALAGGDYVVFGADKKTVNIYLAASKDQDTKLTVSVSGVLEAGTFKKVADYSQEIVVRDVSNPVLTKAELKNGNKELYLSFNETLQGAGTTDDYTLNGQALSTFGVSGVAFDQAAAANNSTGLAANTPNVIKITFNNALPAGSYTLAVKANKLQDPARFYAVNQSAQFTAVADTTAFAVAETKATTGTPGTVEVKFNKDLGTLATTYAVNTATGLTPTLKAGTKDTIIITANVEVGANIVVIPATQRDAFGNKIGETDLRISVDGVKDTVNPTVETVYALTDQKVRVKFSENVNVQPFVSAKANYTVKDASGTVVYSATVNTAGYTINANATGDNKLVDIDFTTPLPGSNYTLEIKGVKDGAGNEMDAYSTAFTSPDKTAPTLATPPSAKAVANTTNRTVEVFFSEQMDASTITNKANYLYKTTGAFEALPSSATIEASANNKSAKITFPSSISVAAITDINVLNVKDVAGNLINGGAEATGAPSTTGLGVTPAVVANSAVATADSDKITVTFDTDQQITKIDKNGFANFLKANSVNLTTAPDNATVSGKTVTLTYNAGHAHFTAIKDAGDTLFLVASATATGTENEYGDVLTIGTTDMKVKDQIKPELAVTNPIKVATANTITIDFNENISDGNMAEIKDDVLITTAGAYTEVTRVDVTANQVTLTTKDALQGVITLNFQADKISVKDVAGNLFVPTTANKNLWKATLAGATAASVTATSDAVPATSLSGKTVSLTVKVDGTNPTETFTIADFSSWDGTGNLTDLVTAIKAATNGAAALSTVADVTTNGNKIVITSKTTGTTSSVAVTVGGVDSADVITLTGFAGSETATGSSAASTGNFAQ